MRAWLVALILSVSLSWVCSLEWIAREFRAQVTRESVPFVHRIIYFGIAVMSAAVISVSLRKVIAASQVWP